MAERRDSKLRLTVKRFGEHWWIVGDEEFGPCGPCDGRAEANHRGVLGTERMITSNKDLKTLTN